MSFRLWSNDLKEGGRMPEAQVFIGMGYSGGNRSPHLAWAGAPEGTKSFVLTAYDPDAPTGSVAEQMPESSYDFKLTPPQMSFAGQVVHLSQALDEFLAPFSGGTANPAKPPSMSKKDVIAFARKSFDSSIEKVSKLTPAQLSKTYNSGEGTMSGLEMLMLMLDHTTHHRASAEMYLRAKGITPTDYQF